MKELLSILGTVASNIYFQLATSAFFGGLFAGLFSNYFESKRRLLEKRRDKYYKHRNTIVQIEHELMPVRINISRNISSLDEALKNTNDSNKRIILRFFKLKLSAGLNLNLLNLKLINLYAETYGLFETINNDIDYISQMVVSILEDKKNKRIDGNLINTYIEFSNFLLAEIRQADEKCLELLSHCKSVLDKDEEKILIKYLKEGKQVKYNFNKKSIKKISRRVISEETRPHTALETRPQFMTPFLDLKRVLIQQVKQAI